MKNLYVISGVTGMTGNELCRQLIAQGHTILGFDNFFASSLDSVKDVIDNPRFIFKEYDLNNAEQMSEIEHTFQTNVASMKTFLDQAIRCGASTFINCSTSEVYSMQSWNENGGVKEDDYLLIAHAEHSQRTSYAVGKLLTEFFMKDAVDKGKIKGCSIRFANVYSNHERFAKHIIPHIFNELLTKDEIVLLENSKTNRRTFLHNIDSCRAVMELMNTKSALDGTVYNVATDEEVTIIELANMIGEVLGKPNPKIRFEGYRASDPERRILNTDKIRTRTNWEPIVSLQEGLRMCAEMYTE